MSTKIKLTYNPFAQKSQRTLLEYNGKLTAIEEGSSFFKCNKQPLQHWINQFFSDVKKEFNTRNVEFEFTGIEADCADVALAIEKAKADGFNISAKFNPQKITAKEVLASLENIRHSIENEPLFNQYIVGNEKYKTLTDNTFDICVVATVSAGKSTFINALLGCDLLPSDEEAMTATITEIHYDKNMAQGQFKLTRYIGEVATEEEFVDVTTLDGLKVAKTLLEKWNSSANQAEDCLDRTAKIIISGNLIGIKLTNEIKLRIFDTPGTNNANNKEHKNTTLKVIQNNETNPLVIYLLQRTTDDDKNLLGEMKKQIEEQGHLGQERFLFLLNKMDLYFKKDNMNEAIEKQKKYLMDNGILNPRIFPISAQIAKAIREDELGYSTEDEDDLIAIKNKIMREPVRDLNQYSVELNSRIKQQLEQMEDSPLYRSGIPALELAISDYIEKYYDLYRIDRILLAVKEIIKDTTPSLAQLQSLKGKSQEALAEILRKIEEAENKLKLSEELEVFIDELKKKEVALSEVTAGFFIDQFKIMIDEINKVGEKFSITHNKETANKLIEELKQKVSHLYQVFVVALEKVDRQEQKNVLADLHQQYEQFANKFIDGKIDVQFAQGFKQQMTSLDNYISFADFKKYTSVERIPIMKKVEWFSTWNIFSWGDKKVVGYEDKTTIDLKKYWREFVDDFATKLAKNIKDLSNALEEKSQRLTEYYANELNQRFMAKLNELNETLKEKVKATDLQEQIQQAEEDLNKAKVIEEKLTQLTQPF